ncbi:MAG: aryl-sulfate sulfotransferase [bacterium]
MKTFLTILSLLVISNLGYAQTTPDIMSKVTTPVEKQIFTGITTTLDEPPADLPVIKVDSIDNPAPGSMFLNTFNLQTQKDGYLMVIDNQANPLYYKKVDMGVMDFKMQPNGLFSYAKAIAPGDVHEIAGFKVQNGRVIDYILDPTYKIIDSVQCANGYLADPHEFLILPNGNYLTISYADVPTDMSKVVKGGNPNANVIATVVQELDKNKNCVFQWRSIDYIPIAQTFSSLLNASIPHVHGNSYYLDTDGNLIVSLASTFEIIKIDMVSGNIIWRFGGRKNQFNITGEIALYKPLYFSMQHDIKRLPNGNFLFYDNGFAKVPKFSRAVEYSVDEANKTAAMVWEYRHTPDIAAFAMGSAQRLPNGNTLIDWGMLLSSFQRMATEVTPDKKIVAEYSLPTANFSYRVRKYQLPACQAIADVVMAEGAEGNTYNFKDASSDAGVQLFINTIDAFTYNYMIVKKFECSPLNPEFEGEAPVLVPGRYLFNTMYITSFDGVLRFDVNQLPPRYKYDNMKVYYRPKEAQGVFKLLPTSLNIAENQLVAAVADTGEFVIGFVRTAESINPPVLMLPANNAVLMNNVKVPFVWSPTGRYDNFDLQIAEDAEFVTIVKTETNLGETTLPTDLEPNKTYYWRTKTHYRDLASEWSSAWSFSLATQTLAINYPKGLDTLYTDSTYVIRWATNLSDSLSIALLKNGTEVSVIKDSLKSVTNAFAWKVPNTLTDGDDYTLIMKSIKLESSLAATTNAFTIMKHSVGVNDGDNSQKYLNITPNPSSGFTKLTYNAEKSGSVQIKIIDLFSTVRSIVIDEYISRGTYNFELNLSDLPAGVYFCTVNSEDNSIIEKIVIMK